MNKDPQLAWLRAFEAAGRLGSFKNAALELHVSASTVSHQVRDLEIYLGLPLFSRSSRTIRLTEEGERYIKPLSAAFALIRSASESLQDSAQHFRIGAFPFLTNEVLLPNVDALKKNLACDQLGFRSDTGIDALLDTSPSQRLDVVIRYSTGDSIPGLLTRDLFDIELVPIQAAGRPPINDVPTLLRQPIVRVLGSFDAWQQWANANGVDQTPDTVTMETDNYHAATLAVARGDGVCLGVFPFMVPWQRAGRIEAMHKFRCQTSYKACLVYAPHNKDNPAISRLQDWLIEYLS